MEIFWAFCIGKAREILNLFIAPVSNMSTAQQIKTVLHRLRHGHGVSGGLTIEF